MKNETSGNEPNAVTTCNPNFTQGWPEGATADKECLVFSYVSKGSLKYCFSKYFILLYLKFLSILVI